MATITCAHCGAASGALEMYLRVDAAMAVHCKKCDRSFGADRMRGCPRCQEHRTRMLVGGETTQLRCEACGNPFEFSALGNCPDCDGAELQFITLAEQVVVDCRQCGRSGDRESMMKRSEEPAAASGEGGCFVATAACGGPDAAEVVELRGFREDVLRRRRLGRLAIAAYEAISPPLARLIARSATLRGLARALVVRPAMAVARRARPDSARGTADGRL